MHHDLSEREFPFTDRHFNQLKKLSREHAGIHVTHDKMAMYYARLAKRLRAYGFSTFDQYISLLNTDNDAFLEFINCITTNVTSFGREAHHFETLKEYILRSGKKEIRIWSSACSSGQEPYSIAMSLVDLCKQEKVRFSILASDIDSNVLNTASAGIYDIEMLDKVNVLERNKFFVKGTGDNAGKCKVKDELKRCVEFRQVNLIRPWDFKYKFDVIFCRNVMIYFDLQVKRQVVAQFAQQLTDNGLLLIGHSENLNNVSDAFANKGKTVYQKL